MASPNQDGDIPAVIGELFDDPDYQRLSEIQTSWKYEGDYEDPTPLLEKHEPPTCPPPKRIQPAARTPSGRPVPPARKPKNAKNDKQPRKKGRDFPGENLEAAEALYESIDHLQDHLEEKGGAKQPLIAPSEDSDEDFESDSSGEVPVKTKTPTQIRQSWAGTGPGDKKLYVTGSLVHNRAPLSFKSGSGRGLEEQGIYQGLVMTNTEKKRLGIMPESIYMTANLEQWAYELEHMSLKIAERESPSPASTLPFQAGGARPATEHPVATFLPPQPIVKYRGSILRPPPLPPLDTAASRIERKSYAVMENLLKSEAAFLTSLNIAKQVYRRPLAEMALGPSPILDKEQVEHLFGPIEKVISHHELFYSALTSRTMEWTTTQRVGDIFMSTFNRKEVVSHYSEYVNNFTEAMAILEKAIKKSKFVTFLKDKYTQSKTSLSLQGLLLKPIQRFPQYILFLQDLLKYAGPTHPDMVHLQMALARFEGIAQYLNEAKRRREQLSTVYYLNNRVSGLPFKLVDSKRWLIRQDVVIRLMFQKSGRGKVVQQKQRGLLLFNNMVLCASLKNRPKRGGEMESSTGSKDFKANDGATYACKWFAPLDKLQVVEPDYHADIWDHIVDGDDSEVVAMYRSLKADYKKLEHDFLTMTKIAGLVSTLNCEYQGLTLEAVQAYIRVLQRKLAKGREQIQQCQLGRLDISIPSRDGNKHVTHTYLFRSERVKQDWLNTLRYSKLKMSRLNGNAWVFAEDLDEDDLLNTTHKLPLFVDSFPLNMVNDMLSVECATKVGSNEAWFASGDSASAQVTVVECVTPSPLILECFKVDSARVMCILQVPPAPVPKARRASMTMLPAHYRTVWMGSQCGKLLVYSADSESSKKCISCTQFPDAITCLNYCRNQVFMAMAEGSIVIFKRAPAGHWDLSQSKTLRVDQSAIRCTCRVDKWLWVGINNTAHILNMENLKIESKVELNTKSGVSVSRMVNAGSGVWVCYRGVATVELYHSGTQTALQQIDVQTTLSRLIAKHQLQPKLSKSNMDRLHVTALMASMGYLWIGTSIGAILIYRIPHLEGVPLISGKPYLAMDGHKEAVRVLLMVKTLATMASTRVSKFISDEQVRNLRQSSIIRSQENGELLDSFEDSFLDSHEEEHEESVSLEEPPSPSLLRYLRRPAEMMPQPQNGAVAGTRSPSPLEPPMITFSSSGRFRSGGAMMRLREETQPIDDEPQGSQTASKVATAEIHPQPYETVVTVTEGPDVSSTAEATADSRTELLDLSAATQIVSAEEEAREPLQESGAQPTEAGDYEESPALKRRVEPQQENGAKPTVTEASDYEESPALKHRVEPQQENGAKPTVTEASDYEESPALKHRVEPQQENGAKPTVTEASDYEESPALKHRVEPQQENGAKPTVTEASDYEESPALKAPSRVWQGRVASGSLGFVDVGPLATVVSPEGQVLGQLLEESAILADTEIKLEVEGENGLERVASPDSAVSSLSHGYDTVHSGEASPYEDPTTLEHGGPVSAGPVLFSPVASTSTVPTIPGRSTEPQEGAVFLLTAGRGLVNLRPGYRTTVLFPTPGSSAVSSSDGDEGCMIAYEVEH